MTIKGPVRVRMAPSPTGFLHIGGARTALFNYVMARHYGGQFILRIEDTDKERSKKEYEEDIIKDLKWLGVEWDEGPLKQGPYAPYYQSQRQEIYDQHKTKLQDQGRVYECFCTPEELEEERQMLLRNHQTPRYMGKCQKLTKDQKSKLKTSGREPVLRFRIDETELIEMNDLIRGSIKVDPQILGDFVIIKADGGPVYNFAAVVDDVEMRITHVLRGEEHISNTPRQILLARALGFNPPAYAHVSIILAPDRTKLSKRHGATSLGEYMNQGFLPEALFNYLSLLGWNPGDEREIMSCEEITESFTLERMVKSPAIFDVKKLSWMNGMYIRKQSPKDILLHTKPFIQKAGYLVQQRDEQWLEKMVFTVKDHLERYDQITEHIDIFFDDKFVMDEKVKSMLEKNKIEAIKVLTALDQKFSTVKNLDENVFADIQNDLKKSLSVPPKVLFQTQRMALTGRLSGPEMAQVVSLLGIDSCRERIKKTLLLLQ